jgi:hypothetical protein
MIRFVKDLASSRCYRAVRATRHGEVSTDDDAIAAPGLRDEGWSSSSELDEGGDGGTDESQLGEDDVGESLRHEAVASGDSIPSLRGRVCCVGGTLGSGVNGDSDGDLGGDDGDELFGTFSVNWDIFARGVGAVIVALE